MTDTKNTPLPEMPDNPSDDTLVREVARNGRELEPFERPVPVITANTETPKGFVKVRVLPKGDGKVATGQFDRKTNSFSWHKKGEHLLLSPDIAQEQEENGRVEIVGG